MECFARAGGVFIGYLVFLLCLAAGPAFAQVQGKWSGYWCQGQSVARVDLTLSELPGSEAASGQAGQVRYEGQWRSVPALSLIHI